MEVGDHEQAKNWLKNVGYYRLSAYWLPFERLPNADETRSKQFERGVDFATITDLYVFDRHLRGIVLEAIERVEVHVRALWTYNMVHAYGAHAHLNHSLFSGDLHHAEQLVRLARAVDKSEETFVVHYKRKYANPCSPPLWAATELMTFGELSKWFQITKDNTIKSKVGRELGLPSKEVVVGSLHVLSYVRNVCAHHSRLWNRRTVKRIPKINRFNQDMVLVADSGGRYENDNRIYNVLVLLLHLMKHQATDSTFRQRLIGLVGERSDTHKEAMGFPEDWRDRPIWQDASGSE